MFLTKATYEQEISQTNYHTKVKKKKKTLFCSHAFTSVILFVINICVDTTSKS